MSLAFDEFGRPYIILREQDKKSRLKGIDAFKVPFLLSLPFIFKNLSPTFSQPVP